MILTVRGVVLALFFLGAMCFAPASAAADEIVAELTRDTPISAYGGAVVWSSYDAPSRRYRLVIRQGGVVLPAPIASARRAFDVSLGPDTRGRVVALYTRCRTVSRGCDVYRYDVGARRERKLDWVSSRKHDEAWPVQWRDRVAFVRRARAYLSAGERPSIGPNRQRTSVRCDVPYVKTPSSGAPARRLDRGSCAETTGMSIRGDSIVQVTNRVSLAGLDDTESQVRRLSARGMAARVLARSPDPDDAHERGRHLPFASPSQSASAVFLTRNDRILLQPNDFVRIDLARGQLASVRPNMLLAGRAARDERGAFWYVQHPEPNEHDPVNVPAFCGTRLESCRLVQASASPFSSRQRTLPPRLRMTRQAISTLYTDAPVKIAGDLTRAVVRRGTIVRREPLPAVAIELLSRQITEDKGPTALAPAGFTTTTDEAGRWSFAVGPGPSSAWYAARAPSLRTLSAETEVSTRAKLTMLAAGTMLTGAVTPAQPGRLIDIERLKTDAAGKPPAGCDPNAIGSRTCTDWSVVAVVALDAAGIGFSTTISRPGLYRASLSLNGPYEDLPYFGTSPPVRVG